MVPHKQHLDHDKKAVLLEERRQLQESSLTRWQYSAVGWEVLLCAGAP